MNKILDMIRDERQKQVDAGFSACRDDDEGGALASAGASYAIAAVSQLIMETPQSELQALDMAFWPWPSRPWHVEHEARDNLIKAAALLVAEAERIEREHSPARLPPSSLSIH